MVRMAKRALSMMLVAAMLLSMTFVTAFAADKSVEIAMRKVDGASTTAGHQVYALDFDVLVPTKLNMLQMYFSLDAENVTPVISLAGTYREYAYSAAASTNASMFVAGADAFDEVSYTPATVAAKWIQAGSRLGAMFAISVGNCIDTTSEITLFSFYFCVKDDNLDNLNAGSFKIETDKSEGSIMHTISGADANYEKKIFGIFIYDQDGATTSNDIHYEPGSGSTLDMSIQYTNSDKDVLAATAINNKDSLTLAVPDAKTGSAELQLSVTNTGLNGAYAGSDAKTTWSITGANTTGAVLSADGKLSITNTGKAGSFTVEASTTAGGVTKTDTATVTITKAASVATEVKVSGAASVTVPTGEAVNETYTAAVTDQFGDPMDSSAVEWSIVPADSTGITFADGTLTVSKEAAKGGAVTATIIAQADEASGSMDVTVQRAASEVTEVSVLSTDLVGSIEVPGLNEQPVTRHVSAVVTDQYGVAMKDVEVQWSLKNAPEGVTIDDSGEITVAPAAQSSNGDVVVKATCNGVSNNTDFTFEVRRAASEAATVKLYRGDAEVGSADTLIIPVSGENTYTYTVKVFDQYGAEMQNAAAAWEFKTADEKVTFANGVVTVVAGATKDQTYTLTATCGGKSVSTTITVKDIEITWPTATVKENPTYGDTWADIVTITGGSASINGTPVAGTFSVKDSTAYPAAGEQSYVVNFTSDDGNYNIDSAAKTVTVAPKAITVTVNPASRAYGEANPAFDFTVPAGALVGEDTKEGLGVSLTTAATATFNVGSYDVTGTASNANYEVTVSGTKALTITKADITGFQTEAPTATILANNAANQSVADLKAFAALPETVTVTYGSSKTAELSINWADAAETFNAKGGTYTYKGTVVPGDNFNAYAATLDATVTVTPVKGTISWDVDALTKAKSEITAAASITDVLGVTTVAVTYDNSVSEGSYAITGSTPAMETLKGYDVSTGDKTVEIVPTVEFPAWATITNADDLKTTLTITEKYPVKVTFTTAPTDITYGGTLTIPVAEQTAINNGIDEGATFTYTYVGVDGTTYGPSATAPTDAGTYQVTAALVSDTHSGSATSSKFTIAPKEVTLTWSGHENLIYDATAKNVTAIAGGLVGDDVCTVTVTGGTETNAGTHTATASALSNANYKLPAEASQEYTIAKADRNLTVETADLLLYPGSLTGQITAATDTDLDKSAVISYTSDNTAAVTVSGSGKVTAVANGKVTITVAIAATENYNAAASQTVTVTALPQPLTGVSVTGGTVTAQFTDGKIVVSGVKDAASELTITPVTAAVEDVTIGTEVADGVLTLKVGETVIATYVIDTTNVAELAANVVLEDEVKETGAAMEGDNADAANAAVSNTATKTDGLMESAAKALNNAALALAESKKAEIEAELGEGAAYTIQVEPTVTFTAKALDLTGETASFQMDIAPAYTVTAVSEDGVKSVELAAGVTLSDSALATAVTVSAKLPDGFPTADLFVRNYLSSGGTEILRVSVADGVATWEQSSFSTVELFADNRGGSIQYIYDDGTVQTLTYDAADLNAALPTDSKAGYTFQGWTIDGVTYKTLTEELLTKLSGTALTATASFQANASSGGGSSTTQYTITVKQSDGGKITPATLRVKKGADQTFTITADTGYVIADVLVDGKSVGAVSSYTFKDVAAAHTIQAVFTAFQFTDVDPDGWAAESIYFLYERGLINGVGENRFSPTRSITRAEFVKILAGVAGVTAEDLSGKTTGFTDVESGSWYEPYVAWAVENGVTSGTSETTFSPSANITREQMAAMIYRYADTAGYTLPVLQPAETFADADTFSDWAVEAIEAMQCAGIINGVGDNRFAPANNATREQACRMLALFLQLMEK